MSKKTDNDKLILKRNIRQPFLFNGVKILNLFHGDNIIYKNFLNDIDIKLTSCEIDEKKCKVHNIARRNSLDFLRKEDLSTFDIIDIDCYGSAYPFLIEFFKNGSAKNGAIVFFTHILASLSAHTFPYYKTLPDISSSHPVILKDLFIDNFSAFLFHHRQNQSFYKSYQTGMKKLYGYFLYQK